MKLVCENCGVTAERITTKKRTKEEYSEQAAYMSLNKNLIAVGAVCGENNK